MKKRIPLTVAYAVTFVILTLFFQDIDGMEPGPIKAQFGLIQIAVVGGVLFAVGCILSLFTARYGIFCGTFASALSLPYFVGLVLHLPWNRLGALTLGSPLWRDQLGAILMVFISSVYSLVRLKFSFGNPTK